jgi:hypothetical protein
MESANRLYGVTMQDPGVSRIISVELADAQRDAETYQQRRGGRGRKPGGEEQAALDLDFSATPAEETAAAGVD